MKTSIATVTIAGDLPEKLEAIQAAGFDGIEIFEQDFIAHDGSARSVGKMVRDHGLEIMLFQPFRDFEGLPEPERSRAFDRAERKFDVMAELGTDLVLFCSSVHPKSLGGIDRCADDFRELGERAARRGVRIGYEALAWGRHVNDHRGTGLQLGSHTNSMAASKTSIGHPVTEKNAGPSLETVTEICLPTGAGAGPIVTFSGIARAISMTWRKAIGRAALPE